MRIWAWGAMVVAVGTIGSMLSACGGGSTTGGGGTGGTGGATVATSTSSKSSSATKSSSVVAPTSSSTMGAKGSECMAQGNMCAPCCQMDFAMENMVLFGTY